MSEEYSEENLDEFMLKASEILSEKNNKEKSVIIDSLKQHISSIFNNKEELDNFFKTLNSVIFSEDLKLKHKKAFTLYALTYSFNPKLFQNFIHFFLDSLQLCITEQNKDEFTFLSETFSEVITKFYSEQNDKKNFLLTKNEKEALFNKILAFCENNIRTNNKLEQSFGCLILTEFIEKCPLINTEKNILKILFQKISEYIDDRWFKCKLDLLNCTISLIFATQEKFKPYANICLFRVMDYLTDPDWMMRKLTINIVYTLVYYCRDEIMEVKENIIEFLNVLKMDENEEIRQVCKNILNLIENENINDNENINEKDNVIDNSNEKEVDNNDNIIINNNSYKNNGSNNKSHKNNNNKVIKNNIKKNNNNMNYSNKKNKNDIEELNSKIDIILSEIKKINEEQENFRINLENLMKKEENNYNNLSSRFAIVENHSRKIFNNGNTSKQRMKLIKYTDSKHEEEIKISNLKQKFLSGKYNEALIDTKQNDKYLLNILPLIEKDIIPKIEIAILEDAISRINKRIYILCMEQGSNSINDILIFYNELLNAKIKIKLITKMRIKDAMNFLKSKGNYFLEDTDMDNIDNILKGLN